MADKVDLRKVEEALSRALTDQYLKCYTKVVTGVANKI